MLVFTRCKVGEKTEAKTEIQSPFLKPSEAAKWLRVTEAALTNWRRHGKGPRWHQPGGSFSQILYRLSDLEEWAFGGSRGGRESAGQVDESAVEK